MNIFYVTALPRGYKSEQNRHECPIYRSQQASWGYRQVKGSNNMFYGHTRVLKPRLWRGCSLPKRNKNQGESEQNSRKEGDLKCLQVYSKCYLTQRTMDAKTSAPLGIITLMWRVFGQNNDVPLAMSLGHCSTLSKAGSLSFPHPVEVSMGASPETIFPNWQSSSQELWGFICSAL